MFEDFLAALLPSQQPDQLSQFYRDTLGLSPTPDGAGHTFTAGRSGQIQAVPLASGLPPGPTALWLEAGFVDHTYAEVCGRRGAPLLVNLTDTYYGAREFQTLDPDGNISCIINYASDLPQRRWNTTSTLYGSEFRVVLYVKNLRACYQFYTQTLGLPCVYEWEENRGDRGYKYAVRPRGAVYVETLFREPLSPLRQATLALRAKDLDTCFQAVRQRCPGAICSPLCGNILGYPGFALSDPDGNRILIWDRQ